MSVCKCSQVVCPKDSVKVLLLKHKAEGGYSFVNLTKGHICPCGFVPRKTQSRIWSHIRSVEIL